MTKFELEDGRIMFIDLLNARFIGEAPLNGNLTEIAIGGTAFLVRQSLKEVMSIFENLHDSRNSTKKGCNSNDKGENV